jgi:hypothetical protein
MLPHQFKVHSTKVHFIYSSVWKPLEELKVAFVLAVNEKYTTALCTVYTKLHSEKAQLHMQPRKCSSLDYYCHVLSDHRWGLDWQSNLLDSY